jgi:1-acyl-sn-glycerol-3-phosphate acyltransferase
MVFRTVCSSSSLFSAVRWGCSSVVTIPWLSCVLAMALVGCKQQARSSFRSWCRWNLRAFNVKYRINTSHRARAVLDQYRSPAGAVGNRSAPPKQGLVFVLLNQTSLSENWLVPLLLPTSRPCFFFSNLGFLLLPWFGWVCWSLGAVVVLRGNASQSRHALDSAKKRVADGQQCYISIEGRRSVDGSLGEYRRGASVLAIDTQATIIPVIFRGARECMMLIAVEYLQDLQGRID